MARSNCKPVSQELYTGFRFTITSDKYILVIKEVIKVVYKKVEEQRRRRVELIYTWVEEYRNIKETGFNFSDKFEVEYKNGKLSIKKSVKKINIFNKNIINITGIIGQNASGKSSLLELMSWNRREARQNKGYFMLYHLKKNEFVIEGNDPNAINSILDCNGTIDKNEYFIRMELLEETKWRYKGFPNFENESARCLVCLIKENQEVKRHFNVSELSSIYYNRMKGNYTNVSWVSRYNFFKEALSKKENHLNFKAVPTIFLEYKDSYLEYKLMSELSYNYKLSHIGIEDEKIEDLWLKNLIIANINSIYNHLKSNQKDHIIDQLIKIESNVKIIRDEIKELTTNELLEKYLKKLYDIFIKESKEKDYYIHLKEIILFLKKEKENISYDNRTIFLDIDKMKENIIPLLEVFDEYNYKLSLGESTSDIGIRFEISFGNLSDGERRIYDIFSQIKSIIDYGSNKIETIVLLLDEPELYLHPEWSRKLIFLINEYVQIFSTNIKIQIILTSHSPFIVSDLPKDRMIFMNKDSKLRNTFGKNIHELFREGFFMKSTVGEFAKQKIEWAINELDKPSEEVDREKLGYIISIIGERFIRKKLEEKYETKFTVNKKEKLKLHFDKLDSKEKELFKNMIKNGEI